MIAHAQSVSLDSRQNKEQSQNTIISAASSTNDELRVTRLTQFFIPIQMSGHDKDAAVAVELIYSPDEGKNWYSYKRIDITQDKFEFNASAEGEYWFAFRTMSKNGVMKQIGKTPQARVRVDTTPPQLSVNAKKNDSGEVVVEWNAEDVSLKPNNVVISLSYDSGTNWTTLATDSKNTMLIDNRETGYAKFWPHHEAASVDIRCELEDLAKNKEIFTTQLILKNEHNSTDNDNQATGSVDKKPSAVKANGTMIAPPPQPLVVSSNQPHQSMGFGKEGNGYQMSYQFSENQVAAAPGTFALPVASASANETVGNEKIGNERDNMLRTFGDVPQPVSAGVMPRVASEISANVSENNDNNQLASASFQQPPIIANVLASTNESGTNPNTTPSNTATIPAEDANRNEPEITFPGKIVLINKGVFNDQPCIIVRWVSGDTAFFGSKVDLYRSRNKYGPWRPIVFDLTNTGEYFWRITPADETPFFLRVELRSTQGTFTDFTSRPISLQ
ncbi:MAG: hypothetical protein LBJ67_14930 [Planctomycetaceae bacterium]|jgi:hypothetical protein|nr:hypothetical protein [Planctomycetaceae bacterium]